MKGADYNDHLRVAVVIENNGTITYAFTKKDIGLKYTNNLAASRMESVVEEQDNVRRKIRGFFEGQKS